MTLARDSSIVPKIIDKVPVPEAASFRQQLRIESNGTRHGAKAAAVGSRAIRGFRCNCYTCRYRGLYWRDGQIVLGATQRDFMQKALLEALWRCAVTGNGLYHKTH